MARTPRHVAFYEEYKQNFGIYQQRADLAEAYLTKRLLEAGVSFQSVSGRAKGPEDLLEKLRRKTYRDPARQVTDLVGARVVTYYDDEVDQVALLVRDALVEVDEARSVDKRQNLDANEFGYRSVHIIGALPSAELSLARLPVEPIVLFEVQIRTLLEHAWAQMEHQVVYKSGVDYPDEFKRRVHAVAGTFEILDRELRQLRDARHEMIDSYAVKYGGSADSDDFLDETLDSARLAGLLQSDRPGATGWNSVEASNLFPSRHSDALCVDILRAAGTTTPRQLREQLGDRALLDAVERYAADSGTAPTEVSHYHVALLVAGCVNAEVLSKYPGAYTTDLIRALTVDDDEAGDEDTAEAGEAT